MNILDESKDIQKVEFSSNQYMRKEYKKTQIYLHHTAGGPNGAKVYFNWGFNPHRIATCVTIAGKPGKDETFKDGQIFQGFDSKYWAYHLGLKQPVFEDYNIPYQSLDRISIAIEVCNWGVLTKKGDKFYAYNGREIPKSDVTELETPYRNFKYFHSYTDAQIVSVEKLLRHWNKQYNIPITYNEDIWNICPRALSGKPGVFTHNSVRYDKVDIYPHPKMVEMLKSL